MSQTTTGPTAPAPRQTSWTEEAKQREQVLLVRMKDLDHDDPTYIACRDELVTLHMPLVEHLARRFRDRGEPLDDLVQVGSIGLIKAVDRFEPDRGNALSTYATPTIVGEIKRHFRDRGWQIRVPRRLQELRTQINVASAELSQKTGQSPTVRELAAYLEIDEEEVIEGLESAQAYSALSLDSTTSSHDDESMTISDTLGTNDARIAQIEVTETLKPALELLTERDRQIVLMRFFENMTQAQIAETVGVSQMHVSRLLARSLETMRDGLGDEY